VTGESPITNVLYSLRHQSATARKELEAKTKKEVQRQKDQALKNEEQRCEDLSEVCIQAEELQEKYTRAKQDAREAQRRMKDIESQIRALGNNQAI
jgi:molecular chaperone GrpE (heat shock protein)